MATLGARELTIAHGENPNYWKWYRDECSGVDVAELLKVCWLDIKGFVHVPVSNLCSNARYEAFLVFKLTSNSYGLECACSSVRFVGYGSGGNDNEGCAVFLNKGTSSGETGRFPKSRGDGWMEIKLGNNFVNNQGNCGCVEMKIYETSDEKWKSGLIVKGIELRRT